MTWMTGDAALAARRGRKHARWYGVLALTGLVAFSALRPPLAHADQVPVRFRDGGTYSAGGGLSGMVTGDVTGDGIADLVMANDNGSGEIEVLPGKSNGMFRAANAYVVSVVCDYPLDLALGDVNNDSKLDIAATCGNSGGVFVLINNGHGGFSQGADVGVASDSTDTGSVAIADVNNDSKNDLVFTDPDASQVDIAFGKGNGTFYAARAYGTGVTPTKVVTGDFNGDTYQDVAVIAVDSPVVNVLLNNHHGGLSTHRDYAVGSDPRDLATGDFNNDGHLDLAVTSIQYGLSILIGNRNGTFQNAQRYWSDHGCGFNALAVGDFNGDGVTDAATSGGSCDDNTWITVWTSNEDGTLTEATSFETDSVASSMTSGLYDADGRSDLAVINNDQDAITVLLSSQAPYATVTVGAPSTSIDDTLFVTNSTPLTLHLTDAGDGSKTLYWRVYAVNSTAPAYSKVNSVSQNLTLRGLPSGNYEVQFYGISAHGLVGDVTTTYFTVGSALPA